MTTDKIKSKVIRVVARITINELLDSELPALQRAFFAMKEQYPKSSISMEVAEPFRTPFGR